MDKANATRRYALQETEQRQRIRAVKENLRVFVGVVVKPSFLIFLVREKIRTSRVVF